MAVRAVSSAPEATGDDFEWGRKRIERALKRHDERCARYVRREDAYLATKQVETDAPRLVRFAYQRMDTLMSYITAEKPVGRIKPTIPGEKCQSAAKLMEKADNEWRRRDHTDAKQVELALTACIYGNAPGKCVWDYQRATELQRTVKPSLLGRPRIVTQEVEVTTRDQPSLVTIDPFDFAWDPSCTDLDDAEYVIQFAYPTMAQLRQGEKEGRYYNLEHVSPIGSTDVNRFKREGRSRDLEGRVEVIEVWARGRLCVIANRAICIRCEDSVFQHHQLPFVIASTMPNLWNLDGSSEVEIVASIQTEMHKFRAAYMFNAELANKCLIMLEGEARDVDKINNALRSRDPIQVLTVDNAGVPPTTWQPTAPLVMMGQNVMQGLLKEMDDISGIGPYISGAAEKATNPATATEISTLQSAAMRRITSKRNQLNRAYERMGNMHLRNTRQFMTRALAIRIDEGDSWAWEYVEPQDVIDADLEYVQTDADQSIDEDTKRTAANLRLQTALAAAQVMALLQQPVPNLAKEYADYLEAYGVLDPAEYLVAPPPPPPPVPPAPPGGSPDQGGGAAGAAAVPVTPPQTGGPGAAALPPAAPPPAPALTPFG